MAKEKNENPEEVGQPKGILDGSKETAKEKIDSGKQKFQKMKKVVQFIKRHPLIAKMLFWVILAIIAIIVFTMIIYAVKGGEESDASLSLETTISNMQKINMDETDNEEENNDGNNTQKMTAGTIKEEDGKYFYEILYGEDSEEKNKERINRVKTELSNKNIEIYNNQCLLFLAVMEENGLDLKTYNKEDLEAMYMFLKAEIATSSLDLGTEGETIENTIVPENKTYLKENYDENNFSNDRIKGTIKVQKITYNAKNGNPTATSKQLKYMPLEKFEELIDSKDMMVTDYFTIDKENNLLVAGWRNNSITYNVTNYNIDGVENEDEKNKLQEYYNSDEFEHGETSVYKYKSIPYLNYVSKYTMPFSFLMSLLATTDNAQFCKDLAKVAEKSSITISLHEEYSHTETLISNVHNEIQKVYANINATVGGSVSNSEVGEWRVINTAGYSSTDAILQAYHGTGTVPSRPNSSVRIYSWQWNNTEYELSTYSGGKTLKARTRSTSSDVKTGNITNVFITKDRKVQGTMPEEAGRFRDITEEEYINHIDLFEELQSHTVSRNKLYTVKTTMINNSNTYTMEITEINNWYEHYQKTYSEVGAEDLSQPENEIEEDITPKIYTNTITDTDEIKNMDYIKEISQEEKNRAIARAIDTEDFENPTFDVTRIQESVFSYGKENIKTNHMGTKYKRAGTEKELVQVKVQKGNETGLLSIAADAFGAQNKLDEKDKKEDKDNNAEKDNKKEDDEEKKKEEIYETVETTEEANSLLYVYDKYEGVQNTFHSIDEWTYEMLDKRSSCKGMTNLLRYLIFLYDGTDLGITEYDLTLLKPDEFKKVMLGRSAIAEWLRSYENNWLREYRNGTASTADTNYVISQKYARENPDTGETEYGIEVLDLKNDHSLNYSYGLRVYDYPSNTVSSGYREYFNDEGMDLDALIQEYLSGSGQGWANADAVDRIQLRLINEEKQTIVETYKQAGVNLASNEVDALLACSYAFGAAGAGIYYNSNIELVKQYKEGKIDVNTVFNNFNGSRGYPFIYGSNPVRGEAHRLMFSEGIYRLSTGEDLDLSEFLEGDLVEVATRLHKKMEEEQWSYYTDTNEPLYYSDIESSTTKTHATCCATYVSSSLYLAGIYTEEEINKVGYNNCGGLIDLFRASGCQLITSSSELEAGDIVFLSYPDTKYQYDHVEIYAGDGTWLGAGSTDAIRRQSPSSYQHSWCIENFKEAYRLVR